MIFALGFITGMLFSVMNLILIAYFEARRVKPDAFIQKIEAVTQSLGRQKAVILPSKTPLSKARDQIIADYEKRGEPVPIENL